MKKGSALLIVLGMVSFMVISSVAFSMYMRTSRLPSNYLRRSLSSRYLLRAALANAIERIDGTWRCELDSSIGYDINRGYVEGVYDDLYPGVNPKGESATEADRPYTGNRWVNRVFSPFVDADPEVTVSTLTLEGLAYLPPALINDVRIGSRRTLTARWSNLTYEFGRYAFCAVDVSDCFDVNKMRASARTSAARQRIGFSSLFRKGGKWSDVDESAASEFNTLANSVGDAPFVSLADFNLACGAGKFSPFCTYVGQSPASMSILKTGDRLIDNALYVTDTWFPPTNAVTTVKRYNLSAVQPFDEFNEDSGIQDILDMANGTTFGQSFIKRLGGIGTICLYDYLDADSVPVSLALPTVETAPMVCAVGLKTATPLKPSVIEGEKREKSYPSGFANSEGQQYENKITAQRYDLQLLGLNAINVRGLAAFPFKRLKGKEYKTDFTYEGYLRVCLGPSDLRTRVKEGSPLIAGDWKLDGFGNGVLGRPFTFTILPSWKDDARTELDAVQRIEGTVDELEDIDKPRPMFWRIEHKVCKNKSGDYDTKVWYSLDGIAKEDPWIPFDKDGVADGWWTDAITKAKPDMFTADTFNPNDLPTTACGADADNKDINTTAYVPNLMVWVKVADGEHVVDLVPACGTDDKTWNKREHGDRSGIPEALAVEQPPIIRFRGQNDDTFSYGMSATKKTPTGAFEWSVLYAVDPRFNFAPEAWYRVNKDPGECLQDGKDWLGSLNAVRSENGLLHERDADIFMFTSDQEYLQSMGELQFLPVLRDPRVAAVRPVELFVTDDWKPDYQFDGSPASIGNYMRGIWETYSAPDGDPIYNLGDPTIEITSDGNDFRVNPFTRDRRVFMSVLANTPYDYYVASTNDALNLLGKKCDFANGAPKVGDGLKYCFNSQTDCAKWSDQEDDSELCDLCDALKDRFTKAAENWNGDIKARPSWESVYDGAAWYDGQTGDAQKSFLGVEMDTVLHGVDRKFLHSFWRECFGTRQQLFLVFVRAEPLTVGGSGTASMGNAQTGARGVALVWRDPEPPAYERDKRPARFSVQSLNAWKKNGQPPAPHRTRVLFYHQFD